MPCANCDGSCNKTQNAAEASLLPNPVHDYGLEAAMAALGPREDTALPPSVIDALVGLNATALKKALASMGAEEYVTGAELLAAGLYDPNNPKVGIPNKPDETTCMFDGPFQVPTYEMKLDPMVLTAPVCSTDPVTRKQTPMARGLLDYFPDALAAVAHVSYVGNQQHNPGEPMHWAKEKSTDHADCIIRHLIDRGKDDVDGLSHTAKAAWRALALLQTELEGYRR